MVSLLLRLYSTVVCRIPYPMQDKRRIEEMFSNMRLYEARNVIFSFGQNLVWRRYLIREAEGRLLDVATGEGNVLKLHRKGMGVGVDISLGMLRRAPKGLLLVRGDAENLPIKDGSFDSVSIAFGLRNVPDKLAALREFNRVLKPGGKVLILEMKIGDRLTSWLALPYVALVMPALAPLFGGSFGDYVYLFRSILNFPGRREMERLFRASGFMMERVYYFHIGSTYLFVGRKV